MGKIEKYKDFARKFQHKWNQDTPTEINLPSYTDELEEKERIEIENNLEEDDDSVSESFLLNGEDTCPGKKIFGVRTSDVPQGHEWRKIYTGKFK